jgi:DNA repair photolyase
VLLNKQNEMKTFNGKAIYNPSGKAGEYSYWACNFYVGCSNGCEYCYCKKGIIAKQLGGDKPTLKKCFKDETDARVIFKKEVNKNIDSLKENGLFFSFTTDPCLKETFSLTSFAVDYCMSLNIPVKILTKQFVSDFTLFNWVHIDNQKNYKKLITIGHTLTGHDELEKNADTNKRRIESMKLLHNSGFKTFASIEPIVDFESSKSIIKQTLGYCDLYKIGLMSGKKYDVVEAQSFIEWLNGLNQPKIYLKESLQKLSRYTNEELGEYFVNRDYKLHESL